MFVLQGYKCCADVHPVPYDANLYVGTHGLCADMQPLLIAASMYIVYDVIKLICVTVNPAYAP